MDSRATFVFVFVFLSFIKLLRMAICKNIPMDKPVLLFVKEKKTLCVIKNIVIKIYKFLVLLDFEAILEMEESKVSKS